MMTRVKRVLSNETVMRRIVFTLCLLLILRVISHIPVPLIDTTAIKAFYTRGESFFAILNSFSGRSLERFSVLSLGITPYITGSIVVQLLVMVIPRIKEWSEEGENGKVKMNKVTRYLAILIGFLQSLALILGANAGGNGNVFANWYQGSYAFGYIYMSICMTAGTTIAIWFADLITRRGVGNGSSILITASIMVSIPTIFTTLWNNYIVNNTSNVDYFFFVLIILIYLAIILGIVFVETSRRNVPIQYSNRSVNTDAKVPVKVNTPNVMPVIFASTILSIPLTVTGFLGGNSTAKSGASFWVNQVFSFNQPIGYIFYVFLIIVFSFFYAFLIVDPTKVAENLSKSNAYIPGVRPGEETRIYIARVLFKVNIIGTFYLVVLASLPIITAAIFGFNTVDTSAITIGGTSLLIVVGVGIETIRQIEADANEGQEQYRGILG